MIELERIMECETNPETELVADVIIALMKRTYKKGHDDGYKRGFDTGMSIHTGADMDAAFKDGERYGYIRGQEDGYDEACMDLTDDDPGSSLVDEEDEEPCETDCPRG